MNLAGPEAKALARCAWSNHDDMAVLADQLLVEGAIAPDVVTREDTETYQHTLVTSTTVEDAGLFRLECAVRKWILSLFPDSYELRHTGKWPDDIRFVVYRKTRYQHPVSGDVVQLGERHRIPELGDREEQPRLLRDPKQVKKEKEGCLFYP